MAERTVDIDFQDETKSESSMQMTEKITYHLALVFRYKKLILKVAGVVLILSVLYAFLWPKTYVSKASLMSISPPNPLGMMAGFSGDGGGMDNLAGLGLAASEKDSKLINILKSRTLAQSVITKSGFLPYKYKRKWNFETKTWKDENNPVPLEKVVGHFRRKIWNVRLDKQDKLIALSANLKDPELAKVIVAVAIGELQRILNDKSFSVAGQNRLFIERRLKEVATDLQAAELELKEFKEKHSLYDIEKQIAGTLAVVAELESQLLARDMEIGMMLKFTTESNPKVKFIRNEMSQIRQQIENVKLGIGTKDGTLEMMPALDKAPDLVLNFIRLKRRFMVQEKLYELLTTQFELAKIEEARDDLAFQILDEPNLPVKAEFPNKRVAVLLGIVFGLFLGTALAYGKEYESEVRNIIGKIKGDAKDSQEEETDR